MRFCDAPHGLGIAEEPVPTDPCRRGFLVPRRRSFERAIEGEPQILRDPGDRNRRDRPGAKCQCRGALVAGGHHGNHGDVSTRRDHVVEVADIGFHEDHLDARGLEHGNRGGAGCQRFDREPASVQSARQREHFLSAQGNEECDATFNAGRDCGHESTVVAGTGRNKRGARGGKRRARCGSFDLSAGGDAALDRSDGCAGTLLEGPVASVRKEAVALGRLMARRRGGVRISRPRRGACRRREGRWSDGKARCPRFPRGPFQYSLCSSFATFHFSLLSRSPFMTKRVLSDR